MSNWLISYRTRHVIKGIDGKVSEGEWLNEIALIDIHPAELVADSREKMNKLDKSKMSSRAWQIDIIYSAIEVSDRMFVNLDGKIEV